MEMKHLQAYCGIAMLIILVFTNVLPEGCAAQREDRSCINKLIPNCLSYLNGTRDPPDSCCDPLKSVIKSNPECLCSMISNKGTKQAEQAGINVNEAQALPGRCGQHVNPISCLTSGGSNSKNSVENSAFGDGSMVFMVIATSSIILQFLWRLLNST